MFNNQLTKFLETQNSQYKQLQPSLSVEYRQRKLIFNPMKEMEW